MNADLAALIRAVRTSLQEEVRPDVDAEQARIQLAAAIDILGKLEGMTAWSPQALREQAQALQEGCRAFEERAAGTGHPLPSAPAPAPEDESSDQAALQRAQARIVQLTDWLFDQGDALPALLRAELHGVLRHTLRQQLVIERRRIPLTDFASMSAGGGRRGD